MKIPPNGSLVLESCTPSSLPTRSCCLTHLHSASNPCSSHMPALHGGNPTTANSKAFYHSRCRPWATQFSDQKTPSAPSPLSSMKQISHSLTHLNCALSRLLHFPPDQTATTNQLLHHPQNHTKDTTTTTPATTSNPTQQILSCPTQSSPTKKLAPLAV